MARAVPAGRYRRRRPARLRPSGPALAHVLWLAGGVLPGAGRRGHTARPGSARRCGRRRRDPGGRGSRGDHGRDRGQPFPHPADTAAGHGPAGHRGLRGSRPVLPAAGPARIAAHLVRVGPGRGLPDRGERRLRERGAA